MDLTLELSDERLNILKRQASDHHLTVEAWVQERVQELARGDVSPENIDPVRRKAQAAADRIVRLQERVKPDLEGWTIRNYIDHGRG
jgi:hypothetical protein